MKEHLISLFIDDELDLDDPPELRLDEPPLERLEDPLLRLDPPLL